MSSKKKFIRVFIFNETHIIKKHNKEISSSLMRLESSLKRVKKELQSSSKPNNSPTKNINGELKYFIMKLSDFMTNV